MYRCALCNVAVAPNRRARQVVTEVRPKSYPMRMRATPVKGRGKKRIWRDDPGGRGWEASKVAMVCENCLPEAQARLESKIAGIEATRALQPVTEEGEVPEAVQTSL